MPPQKSKFITLEQAVKRLTNMPGPIADGATVVDLAEAWIVYAEEGYRVADDDGADQEELAKLQRRIVACQARYELALKLHEALLDEWQNPDGSILDFSEQSSLQPRVSIDSLNAWAHDEFGMLFPSRYLKVRSMSKKKSWEDVEIVLYPDKISCTVGSTQAKIFSLMDVGLMGKKKKTPNNLYNILRQLSFGKMFPGCPDKVQGRDKTAISKIRKILQGIAELPGDPFRQYGEGVGWSPRFRIINALRRADDNAKRSAEIRGALLPLDDERAVEDLNSMQLEEFQEEERKRYEDQGAEGDWIEHDYVRQQEEYEKPDFEDEDDEASHFIKKNQ